MITEQESGKTNTSVVSTNLQKIEEAVDDDTFNEHTLQQAAGSLFSGEKNLLRIQQVIIPSLNR